MSEGLAPDLSGYAEAVRRAKRAAESTEPRARYFLLGGIAFVWLSFNNTYLGLPHALLAIVFSLGALLLLISLLLAVGHFEPLCVAERLGHAMTTLAEMTGWDWTATHVNSDGHPVTTGRVAGEAAGLPFVWDTDRDTRTLRLDLPAAPRLTESARDFDDLQAEAALTAWRQSPEAFPKTAALLKTQTAKGFGRDRSIRVDADSLVIRCTPYKERGLAADSNIARRLREANAIEALAQAALEDRRAALSAR